MMSFVVRRPHRRAGYDATKESIVRAQSVSSDRQRNAEEPLIEARLIEVGN